MITYALAQSLIRNMSETNNTPGWLKFNLGHLVTICAMILGFVLTNQQTQDKVGGLQADMTDLKASFKAMEQNENLSTLSMKELQAKEVETEKNFDYVNKRFEQHDTRLGNLEGQISTLNTNLQLINQEMKYISDSRATQQPNKK